MSRKMDHDDGAAGISWNMLNAYVDDELEPAAAAQVAAAIARDPALAARAATLSRLRAVSRSAGSPESAPPFPAPRAGGPHRPRRLAAAALLAVVALGGLWSWQTRQDRARDGALGDAVAAHRRWLRHDAADPGGGPVIEPVKLHTGGLPDLSIAAMRLAHVSLDPQNQRGGVLAGYLGPNGCRVGLWIGPAAPRLADRPAVADDGDLSIRVWGGTRASYVVMARGISPARLEQLTALIARAMRGLAPEPEERVAASAGAASTCAG